MSLIKEIFNALYYVFPAYCANASPVIFGGGKPIDCGKKFIDGKPIFGPHKTYRGFVFGLIIGTLVGYIQEFIAPTYGLPAGSILRGFTLSLGALIGDLMGSFIKRRLNFRPGAPLPVIDQVSFVVFALLFSLAVEPSSISFAGAVLIIILTAPIHILVNFIAYLLRLKNTPW
ncbi:MAG: CDP-2,3-bis-(O-geranylgeranyl)-sn-glycerol synthase [Candidatus Bathyarchaeota archaeon]|nr:CDP-2,3-bis-(O-geranylgeranyl)-sn-glycerol synthase [Candidatus Bathyarchaeota archaeon]